MPEALSNPNSSRGIRHYLFSTDHKVIGRQYFFLSLAAVLTGAWLSLLMRIHLVWPKLAIPFLGEIKQENYLAYLTIHGTLMVEGKNEARKQLIGRTSQNITLNFTAPENPALTVGGYVNVLVTRSFPNSLLGEMV